MNDPESYLEAGVSPPLFFTTGNNIYTENFSVVVSLLSRCGESPDSPPCTNSISISYTCTFAYLRICTSVLTHSLIGTFPPCLRVFEFLV